MKYKFAELNAEKVKRIRVFWATKKFRIKDIAQKLNVSKSAIAGVIYGYNWRHIS